MKDSRFLRRKFRRSPKQQYSVITSVGPIGKRDVQQFQSKTIALYGTNKYPFTKKVYYITRQQCKKKKTITKKKTKAIPQTSDSTGSQQVDDIYVISQVNEDFQLGHQCLFLRGMSTCCEGETNKLRLAKFHWIHLFKHLHVYSTAATMQMHQLITQKRLLSGALTSSACLLT